VSASRGNLHLPDGANALLEAEAVAAIRARKSAVYMLIFSVGGSCSRGVSVVHRLWCRVGEVEVGEAVVCVSWDRPCDGGEETAHVLICRPSRGERSLLTGELLIAPSFSLEYIFCFCCCLLILCDGCAGRKKVTPKKLES